MEQQRPDPEGRGHGRQLFPEGKRYRFPSDDKINPELDHKLVHIHGVVHKRSHRFRYRYRVPPSTDIFELVIDHHCKEMADKHFPFEAWFHYPGPLTSDPEDPRPS
jgi:hypothetical protein